MHDLLEFVRIRPGLHVIDPGCGTGDITAMLADAIVAWAEGTALIPYLDALDEGLRGRFRDEYCDEVRRGWPGRPVLFGFQRMLLSATFDAASKSDAINPTAESWRMGKAKPRLGREGFAVAETI